MLELLQKGGPIMWLILLCSVVALGVFLERLLFLHRSSIRVGELLGGLSLLVTKGRLNEALGECSSSPGPVARVLQAALLHPGADRETLRSVTRDAALLQIPALERNLSILSTIACVAPLLGLLGTILGLLDAFLALSTHGGYATSAELSRGVYLSLFAAASGLGVSIPALLGHAYLAARANDIVQDMERAGIEMVTLLCDHNQAA